MDIKVNVYLGSLPVNSRFGLEELQLEAVSLPRCEGVQCQSPFGLRVTFNTWHCCKALAVPRLASQFRLQQRHEHVGHCMEMYVYMYTCICMYICMYVCMYVWMDGWMDGWMDVCMYVCMYIYTCIRIYIYIYIHMYRHLHLHL